MFRTSPLHLNPYRPSLDKSLVGHRDTSQALHPSSPQTRIHLAQRSLGLSPQRSSPAHLVLHSCIRDQTGRCPHEPPGHACRSHIVVHRRGHPKCGHGMGFQPLDLPALCSACEIFFGSVFLHSPSSFLACLLLSLRHRLRLGLKCGLNCGRRYEVSCHLEH
jgi:hypothetical protein